MEVGRLVCIVCFHCLHCLLDHDRAARACTRKPQKGHELAKNAPATLSRQQLLVSYTEGVVPVLIEKFSQHIPLQDDFACEPSYDLAY